jgi:sortase A
VLDPERSAAVGEPVLNYGQSVETDDEPADQPSDDAPVEDDVATTDGDGAAEIPADADDERLVTDVDERVVGVEALSGGTARAGAADAFTEGWFSDSGAYGQVALWATALIAIWAGAYLLARQFRRTWVGLVVGLVPFVVALYFFYQNVNRMLPPNL